MEMRALVLILLVVSSSHGLYFKKQLAGPPEEFTHHELPLVSEGATSSQAASFFVRLLPTSDNSSAFSWRKEILVDSTTGFSLAVIPFIDDFVYSLVDPHGNEVPLNQFANQAVFPLNDGSTSIPGTQYNFENPTRGVWHFTSTSSSLVSTRYSLTDTLRHGYLMVWNEADRMSYTHVSNFNNQVGDQIGLVTRLFDFGSQLKNDDGTPVALKDTVLEAKLETFLPSGEITSEQMHDDGLHGDGVANDGVWGATFKALTPGAYVLQATLLGKDAHGAIFRTSEHYVRVLDNMLELNGQAFGAIKPLENRLLLNLQVVMDSDVDTKEALEHSYRPYLQLWGASKETGLSTPVCWASTLTNVVLHDGVAVLQLEVDMKWISRAKVTAPFTLQQVSIQDSPTFIPLSTFASIDLALSTDVLEATSYVK